MGKILSLLIPTAQYNIYIYIYPQIKSFYCQFNELHDVLLLDVAQYKNCRVLIPHSVK